MSKFIETVGLKKYFNTAAGKLHAVDNINLSIEKGHTLGVVGESGCGKSTLGRAIIRLTEPTAGEVYFDGESILGLNNRELKAARTKMQMIFQDPYSSLDPRMKVSDLISEPMIIHGTMKNRVEREELVLELMDQVGLAKRFASSYPHELDGGRRQRIGIARALSINPKFIVCDEPVSALDVSIQAQILNLLMDLQDRLDLTYMFITHDLSVVRHISDDIMVMYLGQCIESAPAEEIFRKPLHPYTRALLSAIPRPDISCREEKAVIIRGEVTSPIDPPPGCRFAPRCENCSKECTERDFELIEHEPGHRVACRLYE